MVLAGGGTSGLGVAWLANDAIRCGKVGASGQVTVTSKPGFKLVQVFGIDLLGLDHEFVKLRGHLTLDLQLLHVAKVSSDRILSEEVAHEDLFDVGLLVESGASLGKSTGKRGVSGFRFPETQRLDCVHFC